MNFPKLVERIPRSVHVPLSERLMDALLVAKEGDKVPSALSRSLLLRWKKDELASAEGLAGLLEAVVIVDPPAAEAILDEFSLGELKPGLRAAGG